MTDQQLDELDEPRLPWAEQTDDERQEFWDDLVVARDEDRYQHDRTYRRRIDAIVDGFRWAEHEYPLLLEYHESKVVWYEGESAAAALKTAKDADSLDLHELGKVQPSVDCWLDVAEINRWHYSGYEGFAYDSRTTWGPLLPNGGTTMAGDRRTAEYEAHYENARRAEAMAS